MSTATFALDAETAATARDALSAVQDALTFFNAVLRQAPVTIEDAHGAAWKLHRVAEAMTTLAEQAEELPENVVDFAAAYRKRRDRIRAGGSP